MRAPRNTGLTWVEVLVALVVVFVGFVILAVMVPTCDRSVGQMLSNMKQLQIATQQMALDGVTNSRLGWPGETGGTFSQWANDLVPEYLSTNDFRKLLSGPGIIPPVGKIPSMEETALLLYAVREDSPDDAVFLTSANFTNTPAGGIAPKISASPSPFWTKRFYVFRKGGDGAILQSRQAGQTNVIGSYVPLCQ